MASEDMIIDALISNVTAISALTLTPPNFDLIMKSLILRSFTLEI